MVILGERWSMGDTVYTRLSETMIGRLRRDTDASYLRDDHYPALRFRYRTVRTRGTWDVFQGGRWRKVGNYPELNCPTMLERLPRVIEQLKGGARPVVSAGMLVMTGQLLTWFSERQLRTRTLSSVRKSNCKSVMQTWLLPRLSAVPVADLDKVLLDRLLIHPMQEAVTPAYIRQVYGLLVAAIRCAVGLGLLASNPLIGVKFTDFGLAKIKPKVARLRPGQLVDLLPKLVERFERDPRVGMLALLMLCHGTRVGETRQARWSDFHEAERLWIIPAEKTKTRTQHELPLTPQMLALLKRYRATCGDDPGEYLFPGECGQPLSAQAVTGLFMNLSEREWTSHDLRKLARACWAEIGVDWLPGELLLNHASPLLTATYVQTELEALKREALERWHGEGGARFAGLNLGGWLALV
ncbi:site-specific integrase [Pseudomonas sp. LS44]|uniref:tyrosine-type recombinase/integrase n=1 Tax=Pseudomonas sp. LS44 TaxID=1357074 RepID=UPI00215B1AF7|nr:site-specific integrase [Pseudomonas sp. LS44]UVE19164.1 site-specific integrase [Pseudomonas sp. LS44]